MTLTVFVKICQYTTHRLLMNDVCLGTLDVIIVHAS